jgi:hypothetical protein
MNKVLLNSATVLVSAMTGAGVTYMLVKKHYEDLASWEIAEFKEAYINQNAIDTAKYIANDNHMKKSNMDIAENIIKTNNYTAQNIQETLEQNKKIFIPDETPEPVWDQEVEESKRDENPYIISQKEFDNEDDYTKIDLTYFLQDDVLIDSDNDVVPDVDIVIGENTLNCFGHGSNDPYVVYVRNDDLETDFKINYQSGSYEVSVLGYIEHADKPKNRKFKNQDY